MSIDICITTACEGVEDTAMAQVNDCIARYRSLETTTIDKLGLSHFRVINNIIIIVVG